MGKECFTCGHKLSNELSIEEKKVIKEENKKNNKPYERIPDMVFNCKVTGKQIKQIDPACDKYLPDDFMVRVRKDISKTARKLRKEL